MPVVVAPSTAVNDLAQLLTQQLGAGQQPRATLGAKTVAFSWTSGLAPVVAGHVNGVLCQALSFDALIVGPSATPAKLVAEGAAKPSAVTLTPKTVPLAKYAGMASFSTEATLSSDMLAAAITATLVGQALLAFDADVVTTIDAGAGLTATGATWNEAILAGVAAVVASGGNPDLIVLSGADYAAAVGGMGIGWQFDPTEGVPILLGLEVVVSAAATAGTFYVLDRRAVTVAEHVSSPLVVVDPYSGLSTNQIRLVAELLAGSVVSAPGSVAKVTKTAVAAARTAKSS